MPPSQPSWLLFNQRLNYNLSVGFYL
jgi:hypothetical protein